MYRIRFNLGRGKNFMKWKVVNLDTKEVNYYDPVEVELVMGNCRLINNKNGAQRIFDGRNKYVVAWVECETVEILPPCEILEPQPEWLNTNPTTNYLPVNYNPRIAPHWVFKDKDADNKEFEELFTIGKQVVYNSL